MYKQGYHGSRHAGPADGISLMCRGSKKVPSVEIDRSGTSAPPQLEGKVAEVEEIDRRAAEKRKLYMSSRRLERSPQCSLFELLLLTIPASIISSTQSRGAPPDLPFLSVCQVVTGPRRQAFHSPVS
jgi:hypothetical protein